MPELQTARLRLRPVEAGDFEAIESLWRDPSVVRYLPTGLPRSASDAQLELVYMTDHWQRWGFGMWAVCLGEPNELIGYCGLQYLHEGPGGVGAGALAHGTDVEIAYGLSSDHWGRGYASEAAHAALRHGFDVSGLPRVIAAIHPNNVASRRILEGLGLHETTEVDYYGACPHFLITKAEYDAR